MDQASNLREQMLRQESPQNPQQTEASATRSRVIAVTSGKGGVGKTSFSVNLAIQLKRMGKKVVIIDADLGLSNVEVMLGIRPRHNLADLIYNNLKLADVITTGPMDIGIISGGSGVQELVNLDKGDIKLLIAKLSQLDRLYDVIIIDTGAGISDAVLEFLLISPEILLVVTPEPTSITDAYALLKTVNRKKEFEAGQKTIHVLSNRVEDEDEGREIYDKLNTVSSKFLNVELKYIGYICHDREISRAVIAQKPILISKPQGPTSASIANIADRILHDRQYDRPDNQGIAGMFLNYFKMRRKGR